MSTDTTPNYPLVYKEPPFLRLAVVYNPFDLTQTQLTELEYNQNFTLADYLQGLPEEVEWLVGYNGQAVDQSAWGDIKPAAFSSLSLVRIPEGGKKGGLKSVLRVVAIIAVAVFATWAAPMISGAFGMGALATKVIAAGIMMAGGALVNAILPVAAPVSGAAAPGSESSNDSSRSYGVDGPKNASREGIVLPKIYGTFRVGGNIIDVRTENKGEDQFLYMRTALNDGRVESISDILINDQPLTSYKDVEYRIGLGDEVQAPNDWFLQTVRMANRNTRLSLTPVSHKTEEEVDKMRIDITFPRGLVEIDDKGDYKVRETGIGILYRALTNTGDPLTDWSTLPIVDYQSFAPGAQSTTPSGVTSAKLQVKTQSDNPPNSGTYAVTGYYRKVGDTVWITSGTVRGHLLEKFKGSLITAATQQEWPTIEFSFAFPEPGQYELKIEGGTVGDAAARGLYELSGFHVFSQKTTKPIRMTFESTLLQRGRYEVAVWRTSPESENDRKIDECWLTDVSEIDVDGVNLNGVANLSLRIKASDQLSGVPKVTCLVKGSHVATYSDDGIQTGFGYTENPAWIVADILHNPLTGAGYPTNKSVWTTFTEFADHCSAGQFNFNGVFDASYSMWDAAQAVARVGRGTLVPRGTKFSIAIDREDAPKMVFTQANYFKDSFSTTWHSIDDRANEIQVIYYDKLDGYRQRTLRLADNVAFARGDMQKIVSLNGFGIDNSDQAAKEAEYTARNNRYLKKTVEFDAPIESIAVNVGDVALIQHDGVAYGDGIGGRVLDALDAQDIRLDGGVPYDPALSCSILFVHSALQRYTGTVSTITGNNVVVSGIPAGGTSLNPVVRLRQGTKDVAINKVYYQGPGTFMFIVDEPEELTEGFACSLWDTDVIEERDVAYYWQPLDEEETQFAYVHLASPLSVQPSEFTHYLFGPKTSVRQPYRLRSIAGNDIHRRHLSFVQYDERVYQRGGWPSPLTTSPPQRTVGQVTNFYVDFDRAPLPDQQRLNVRLYWVKPYATSYGGADIYWKTDTTEWKPLGTVLDVTTFSHDFNRGDIVSFKVVAFDGESRRASFANAPEATMDLAVYDVSLDPPTNLTYEVPYFKTEATIRVSWEKPVDDDPTSYRVEVLEIDEDAYYDTAGLADEDLPPELTGATNWGISRVTTTTTGEVPRLDLGWYVVRVRSQRGFSVSRWTYLRVQVEAPALPDRVTGLRLDRGDYNLTSTIFNGRDAKFVWREVAVGEDGLSQVGALDFYWQDYYVQILTPEGTIIRQEAVKEPRYTYTLEKNMEDHKGSQLRARRQFMIRVYLRGRQGQLSTPAQMTVNNPSPSQVEGYVYTGVENVYLDYRTPNDNDFAGLIVWASTTTGFTPADSDIVFQGPGMAMFKGLPRTTYYVRFAAYDVFGIEALNISPEYQVTTSGVVAAHTASDFFDSIMPDLVRDQIELISGDGEGSVNARVLSEELERIDTDRAITEQVGLAFSVANQERDAFIQPEAPETASVGDIWYDSDADNLMRRWNGSSWLVVEKLPVEQNIATIITHAKTMATGFSAFTQRIDTVAAVADGRNRRFFQPNEPAGPTPGDIWVDSDASNATFRWNGSVWEAVAADTMAANFALIQTVDTARADGDSALADAIDSVSSSVNGLTTTVETQATSIDGIRGVYSVRINNNGDAAGFDLISDLADGSETTSKFKLQASQIEFYNDAGSSGVAPFSVSGGIVYAPQFVAGSVYANSITAAMIQAGQITAGHIAAETIEADRIKAGVITADRLILGAIDTARMGVNAATVPSTASGGLIEGAGVGSPSTVVAQTIYMDYPGWVYAHVSLSFAFPSGNKNWAGGLMINGSQVDGGGGTVMQGGRSYAGALYCAAGFVTAYAYWGSDAPAQCENSTIFIMGCKR